jgi:hypothetical protein
MYCDFIVVVVPSSFTKMLPTSPPARSACECSMQWVAGWRATVRQCRCSWVMQVEFRIVTTPFLLTLPYLLSLSISGFIFQLLAGFSCLCFNSNSWNVQQHV